MDRELECFIETITRLDIRINKLLKMRKNIVLDKMHLFASEINKTLPSLNNKS